jgi:hypothetical protein
MVRPEKWHLRQVIPVGGNECALSVTITAATFLGDTIAYDVVTGWGQTLTVRETVGAVTHDRLAPGKQAVLSWRPENNRFFVGPAIVDQAVDAIPVSQMYAR